MDQGQPDERNSSSAHTVKEQFAPEENRDIVLFNTDNEFNRAINEEDIDFQHSRTTTFCELLDVQPKAQCKIACRTGTSASSTARAGTSCETEQRKTRNSSSTLSISSRFPITTSRKGDPTGTVTGRSRGITSTSPRIRSRRNARKSSTWVSTTLFIRDEKFRKNMFDIDRNEEICREMDKLADEDHTHHITPEEIRV